MKAGWVPRRTTSVPCHVFCVPWFLLLDFVCLSRAQHRCRFVGHVRPTAHDCSIMPPYASTGRPHRGERAEDGRK